MYTHHVDFVRWTHSAKLKTTNLVFPNFLYCKPFLICQACVVQAETPRRAVGMGATACLLMSQTRNYYLFRRVKGELCPFSTILLQKINESKYD